MKMLDANATKFNSLIGLEEGVDAKQVAAKKKFKWRMLVKARLERQSITLASTFGHFPEFRVQ